MKFRRSSAARRRIAADAGKPLTAQLREAVSYDLGALARTATAARETALSGVPVTGEWLQGEVVVMEKILIRLRKAAAHV